MVAENDRCPSCGQDMPANTPQGLCPACLLRTGMESEAKSSPDGDESGPTAAPRDDTPAGSRPFSEGPGSRIGPYKLLQEIGEGGMGVVYMAEQETPVRRRVALKIIKPGMDTSQVIARFEAERQALALMDHQHIAKVLDAGATDTGRPYFVMELVQGRSDHRVLRPQSAHSAKRGSNCSSRFATRSSMHIRRGSSTATSSRRTCWSRSTTASRWPR